MISWRAVTWHISFVDLVTDLPSLTFSFVSGAYQGNLYFSIMLALSIVVLFFGVIYNNAKQLSYEARDRGRSASAYHDARGKSSSASSASEAISESKERVAV